MADDLNTILTNGAASDEDRDRLAGNVQDASIVAPAGSVDNPAGSTPTGAGTDNTITEQAPESQPPAAAVTQVVQDPTTDVGGGGGGLAGGTSSTENPVQPTVVQTAVAQSDPTLGTTAALVPGEAPNGPPTVAVLPGTPDAPPEQGVAGPGDDDDIFNDQLRADPNLTLPAGAVAELGLENEFGALATTRGTIVVNDPDGIQDIATVTIAGVTYTLAELNAIDPANTRYQILLEAGDGDDISEGTLILESFNPATGEISFRFDLKTPVDNDGSDNPNINENSALIPIQVTVTDLEGATATADGGIRIVDATPVVTTSALAGAPDPFVSDDDALGKPIVNNFADNFAASFNPGSDGESARSTSYELSLGKGATGLFDLAGNEIVLVEENGVITGVAGGVPIFTVSVDAAGNVTLTQLQPLQHLNAEGQPNDSLSLPAGLINLTRTDSLSDTDGDTDVTSATIEISGGMEFLDSVPSISTTGTEPVLTVDETVLAANATQNFAANFTSAFGADAAGSLTYAVGTAAGDSGLVDTATGEIVNLVNNAGVIEGRTVGTNQLVFTVTVNTATGVVTLDQIRAVVHPTLNPNEAKSLSADDLVTVTATITDKDGDTENATLNIGTNLVFLDDGPTIQSSNSTSTVTIDAPYTSTSGSPIVYHNVSIGNWSFGADGPSGSPSVTLTGLPADYTATTPVGHLEI